MQGARNRLTRRTGPGGELVLRQRQRDPHSLWRRLARLLDQLDQATRDTRGYITRRELDALAVRVGQQRCHVLEHQRGPPWMVSDETPEVGRTHRDRLDLIDGGDGRRSRAVRDRCEHADQLAGAWK